MDKQKNVSETIIEQKPDIQEEKPKRGRPKGSTVKKSVKPKTTDVPKVDFAPMVEMLFKQSPENAFLSAKPHFALSEPEIKVLSDQVTAYMETLNGDEFSPGQMLTFTATMIFLPRIIVEVRIAMAKKRAKKESQSVKLPKPKPVENGKTE